MKLSEVQSALVGLNEVRFELPNGDRVPEHFHVTEVGQIDKYFMDCGGTVRKESVINFQLFTATDYDHRLSAQKLSSIISLSQKQLSLADLEVEVEFQGTTIEKYHLAFERGAFRLVPTKTDCLAKDACGIPTETEAQKVSTVAAASVCTPGSGCC